MIIRAYQEHYKAISFLIRFRESNYKAFTKILKKYNKYVHKGAARHILLNVHRSPFFKSTVARYLMKHTEYNLITNLFNSDRKKAMEEVWKL